MDNRIEKRGEKKKENTIRATASIKKERPKIESIEDLRSERARKVIVKTLIDHGDEYIHAGPMDSAIAKNARELIREKLRGSLRRLGLTKLGDTFLDTMHAGKSEFAREGIKTVMGSENGQGRLLDLQLKLILKECKFLEKNIGKNSLDFGCGVGWFTHILRNNHRSESYGVDTNESMIALGKFFGVKNLIKLKETGKKYKLPFPDGFFGSVFSVHSLFMDPEQEMESNKYVLQEIARVTKPFGALLISPYRGFEQETGLGDYSEIMRNELGKVGFEFAHANKSDIGWGVWLKV